MTSSELLDTLHDHIIGIGIELDILDRYEQIKNAIGDDDVVDYFYQVRKNDIGEGLAFEILIVSKKILHDLVITQNKIELISAVLSYVNQMIFALENSKKNVDLKKESMSDKVEFQIWYSATQYLKYNSSTNKLDDFLRIRKSITNLLNI